MIHPWRSALAGALLAGIAIDPARAQGDLESLLPEGTMVCASSADLEAFLQQAKTKATGKILSEQEVRDFLAKPLTQLNQMIEMGIAAAKSQPALADMELDPKKMMKGPFGRALFAITHIDMPASDGGAPDVGLVMALEAREGAVDVFGLMRSLVHSLAASEGAMLQVQQIEVGSTNFERTIFEEDDSPPLCFAKVGSLSILTISEKSMRDIVARASGAPGVAKSLASSDALGKSKSRLGEMPSVAVSGFADPGAMFKVVRSAVDFAAAQNEQISEQEAKEVAMFVKALDYSELEKIGPVYMVSSYDGDVAVTRSSSSMDPQAGGIVRALSPFMQPVDKSLIQFIPPEAVSFSLGNFDIAPMWDTIMDGMRLIAPEIHGMAEQQIQMMSAQVGGVDPDGNPLWNLRRDLIGAIGGPYFSMSTPGAASMFGQSSNTVFFLGCKDADAFQRSVDTLIALPGQMAGFPIQFKEKEHNGVKIKTLDAASLGPAAMLAAMVQPTYAISNGRFYAASSPTALTNFLDSQAAPLTANVTTRPDFQRHYSKLPAEATFSALSYGDTKTNFETLYNSVLGILPMAMMQMPVPQDQLPVDINLLPTAEAISQHLFGSVNATIQTAPGTFITEMRSPFGMETALALGGLGMGLSVFWLSFESRAEPRWEEGIEVVEPPAPMEPMDQAWSDLQNLSVAITVYTVECDAVPTSLAELTGAKPGYPSGFLPTPTVPTDPWGNAYQYSVNLTGGYRLWSFGQNGTNEQGEGDDLKIDR